MFFHRSRLPLAICLAVGCVAGEAQATGHGHGPADAVSTPSQVSEASAELLSTSEIQRILEIARGYGEAEIDTTQDGEPVISGDLNGIAYQLFFFECPEPPEEGCAVLNFYAIWDTSFIGMESVNAWNRTNPFHKVYLTEDALPVVELNLLAPDGVLTVEQMDEAYARYTVALAAFQTDVISAAP